MALVDPVDNESMCRYLQQRGFLSNEDVASAFSTVDRADFFPHVGLSTAAVYRDMPIKVGHAHMSAPFIYATALHELNLR
jgi:protein-L-isoaspartate O-methyltransferase